MSTSELDLGDGAYVSFDGFAFTLRAPREHGDHYVILEPWMLSLLIRFAASQGYDVREHAPA